MPPTLPARILPRPTTTASGAAAITTAAPTLLTATPAVLAPTLPPTPIPTLLGTPEPEPRSHADILFGSDPAPTAKAPPAATPATPSVDRRQAATRNRTVAQQTLTTPGRPKDPADIPFGADRGLGKVQQESATKNTRIAQRDVRSDSPVRQPAPAPKKPTTIDTEAARRRTSEQLEDDLAQSGSNAISKRLEDDPAQADPFEINDTSYALRRPTNTDPAHTEIVLRRKIREAVEDGNHFAASQAKHFLDGGGKERRFTREEAHRVQQIRDAEDDNKKRFVESLRENPIPARPEILDPDGGPGSPGRTGFRGQLLGLTEPIAFDDVWVRDISLWDSILDQDKDFLAGAGRSKFVSTGRFTAHRKGETIIVTGVITHDWNDLYNFDKNAWPQGFNHRGWILQQSGRGKIFRFGATWRQRMTVRIEFKDGKPIFREPEWEELDGPA
jgi:hypothetical protein